MTRVIAVATYGVSYENNKQSGAYARGFLFAPFDDLSSAEARLPVASLTTFKK